MRTRLEAVILGISLAAGTPLAAHHYSASIFDGAKAVQLTGILSRIEWKNPHLHFYLDVKDDSGRVSSWTCETGSPSSMARRGLNRRDIKLGDTLVVEGYRAKDGSRFVVTRRITLPDGRVVSRPLAGDGSPP